jgi:hypothetical protein
MAAEGGGMRFRVIDKTTGIEPDLEYIALKEEWAKHLVYCDMDGFALTEDGILMLFDECGSYAFCPLNRFTVVIEIDK